MQYNFLTMFQANYEGDEMHKGLLSGIEYDLTKKEINSLNSRTIVFTILFLLLSIVVLYFFSDLVFVSVIVAIYAIVLSYLMQEYSQLGRDRRKEKMNEKSHNQIVKILNKIEKNTSYNPTKTNKRAKRD